MNALNMNYNFNGYESSFNEAAVTAAFSAIAGVTIFIAVVGLALAVLMMISWWKIFAKAGKPAWAAIVPVYNLWILFEIVGLPGWTALLMLIPFVGTAIIGVLNIIAAIKLPALFGKEQVYSIGLIFLPMVFYPMLAFGKAEYVGEGAPVSAPVEPSVEE